MDADLAAYVAFLQVEAAKHPFVDLAQARDLAARLSSLLRRWPDLAVERQEALAEVIAYFVDPADDEHDTLSPIGLVDDEAAARRSRPRPWCAAAAPRAR